MSQSADTETQPKNPNSTQCRCRSKVARKNSLERQNLGRNLERNQAMKGGQSFWLCRVEIITEHGQDVQMLINDQHGQIIIITGRTVATVAAAQPGGLGTARSHHAR